MFKLLRWGLLAALLLGPAAHAQDLSELYFSTTDIRYADPLGVNKFGRNMEIDSAAAEDVWDGGANWVLPTAARVHQVVSTSVNDTSDGTGARTVQLYGLSDWDTAESSQVVTMNGTTDVPTLAYVIIHRMKVLTKGASGPNVGVITATADTDATVTAQINAGEGQTQMAVYGVPSGHAAYLTSYYASVLKAQAVAMNLSLLFNPEPGDEPTTYVTKHTIGAHSTGATGAFMLFAPYMRFAGPGVLKMRASVSGNGADVSAGFNLLMLLTE